LTVTLLAIVDPIASHPGVLTTTDGSPTCRGTHRQDLATTVFLRPRAAALVGTEILHFFGISIPSFLIGRRDRVDDDVDLDVAGQGKQDRADADEARKRRKKNTRSRGTAGASPLPSPAGIAERY